MKFKLFGRLRKEEPHKPAYEAQNEPARNEHIQQNHAASRPLPEDRVVSLLSQGLAEPEIIRMLKEEGYSFQEIDSGITNVLKQRVSDNPSANDAPFQDNPVEDLSPVFRPNPAEAARNEAEQRNRISAAEEMEEVIETLIEEKFSKVLEEFQSIDKKFLELNEKVREMNTKLAALESQEKGANASEIEKINALDAKEDSIEPRIASLEKAFKDIIPNLVDSIRELRETASSSKHRDFSAREFVENTQTESGETKRTAEEEKSEKESIFD